MEQIGVTLDPPTEKEKQSRQNKTGKFSVFHYSKNKTKIAEMGKHSKY